jgi:Flagellar basal body P-ring biosynthesis protein
MNKRLILKTAMICIGIFIIMTSLGIYYLLHNYEFDTEKKFQVLIASTDILPGDIINESMVSQRTIKNSSLNSYMITDTGKIIGKKALSRINTGDYIVNYNLLPKDKWHTDDEKIIILPMDIEARLANLIRKGSLIDIKVAPNQALAIPETVLSKVTIEDILDENGLSLGNSLGSKKAYAVVILNNEQRNKVYIASQIGKLIFELYCDNSQKPAAEEFKIPAEYFSNTSVNPITKTPENPSMNSNTGMSEEKEPNANDKGSGN